MLFIDTDMPDPSNFWSQESDIMPFLAEKKMDKITRAILDSYSEVETPFGTMIYKDPFLKVIKSKSPISYSNTGRPDLSSYLIQRPAYPGYSQYTPSLSARHLMMPMKPGK